ncbi:hypothetical protein I79_021390 [Cricetulus griseus]|uniref:Uncharacterized protein n=1 Tax=Cricetulus griseus TaxID=10029 RepID=G3ICJ2_CRIGR|nr:hypothetical protein I79_021390 [Cricetulus griseus]
MGLLMTQVLISCEAISKPRHLGVSAACWEAASLGATFLPRTGHGLNQDCCPVNLNQS